MPAKQTIDIEYLVAWALSCTGRLPWARDDPRDLSLDQGCTAKLRRRPHTTWEQAQAYAGMRADRVSLVDTWNGLSIDGHALSGWRRPGDDAQAVLAAIQQLDPASAALVLRYGQGRRRPDAMIGVTPTLTTQTILRGSRRRKIRQWYPCSSLELDAIRADYTRWHEAMQSLAQTVGDGRLRRWQPTGPRAPERPWDAPGGQ